MKTPKIFISYSWDSENHQKWVLNLANELVANGVDVVLDQYELKLGKNLNYFMEKSINNVDKVLLILTENYKKKAEGRQGGVGYEYSIINSAWYQQQTDNKRFIPILRNGDKKSSIPVFVNAFIYLDMRTDIDFDEKKEELLRTIYNSPKVMKPPLGNQPDFINNKNTTVTNINNSRVSNLRKIKANYTKKQLFELISSTKTKSVINKLIVIAEDIADKELNKELHTLLADFTVMEKKNRLGISTNQEHSREFSRINYSLLELIDNLNIN